MIAALTRGVDVAPRHGRRATTSPDHLLPNGLLARGANIVPEVGFGDWHWLWRRWTWDAWIKWQIDKAVTLGANTIRLMGTYKAIYDTNLTRAAYDSQWRQLLDYTASLGLWFYPCGGGDFLGAYVYDPGVAFVTDQCAQTAALINTYDHVIGYDMVQERTTWADCTVAPRNGLTVLNAVRRETNLPVTFSLDGNPDTSTVAGGTLTPVTRIAAASDYIDFHCYPEFSSDPATAWLQTVLTAYPNKAVLIGEAGASQARSSAQRQSAYNNTNTVLAHVYTGSRRLAGGLAWAITDHTAVASTMWGLFDAAGTERTDMADIYETWPVS